ncbi:hypothetical protein ACFSSC_06235 [Corynebacterium mendelii]|uniref:Uncharacterized protein n=1 Tax=Corynebacterium mendelii TaxID=2765362 RepID=A0A939E0S0_9CORY|nr:hypothetical protein [Corynebacterium mendelii]MBN9644578.1 hypothetical protein [Corynebacterium mendelii]
MSDVTDEIDDLLARAGNHPYGAGRVNLFSRAVDLAQSRGRDDKAVYALTGLANVLAVTGRCYEEVAPFAALERYYDSNPELFDRDLLHGLYRLQWSVAIAAMDNPAVPARELDTILSRHKKFAVTHGQGEIDPLLLDYRRRLRLGDTVDPDGLLSAVLAADPSPWMACCDDCGMAVAKDMDLIRAHAAANKWIEAQPVIASLVARDANNRLCDQSSLMANRYGMTIYLLTGNDEKAFGCYRKMKHHLAGLHPGTQRQLTAPLQSYLGLSARHGARGRIPLAVAGLCRGIPTWSQASSHGDVMVLAGSASHIARAAADFPPTANRRLPLRMSAQTLISGVDTPELVHPLPAELARWLDDIWHGIREMFTTRDGVVDQRKLIDRINRSITPEHVPDVEEAGGKQVVDISCLSAVDDVDYRTTSHQQGGLDGAADQAGAAAAAVAAGQGNGAEEQAPYISLDLHGPWRSMDLAQLVAAHAAHFDPGEETVYFLRGLHLLVQHPALIGHPEQLGITDDKQVEFFRRLSLDAQWFSTRQGGTADMDPSQPNTDDPAYLLMNRAQVIEDDDLPGACRLMDEAMRTPSIEPIGVRMQGLAGLSDAAGAAGYPGEALECARQMMNLAAALGLPFWVVAGARRVMDHLSTLRRGDEAIDVAETALLYVEDFPGSVPEEDLRVEVLRFLNDRDDARAAEHMMRVAEIHLARGIDRRAVTPYVKAAVLYQSSGRHAESVYALSRAKLIVDQMADDAAAVAGHRMPERKFTVSSLDEGSWVREFFDNSPDWPAVCIDSLVDSHTRDSINDVEYAALLRLISGGLCDSMAGKLANQPDPVPVGDAAAVDDLINQAADAVAPAAWILGTTADVVRAYYHGRRGYFQGLCGNITGATLSCEHAADLLRSAGRMDLHDEVMVDLAGLEAAHGRPRQALERLEALLDGMDCLERKTSLQYRRAYEIRGTLRRRLGQ